MSDNTQKDNKKNVINNIYKYDSGGPDNLPRVEDSNEKLLSDPESLYQYFFAAAQEIIKRENITYNGFSDPKKTGAVLSYNQFRYILTRLNDLYITPNPDLVKSKGVINTYTWDFNKLEKLYNVYVRLCKYYNYNCTVFPFIEDFLHIDEKKFTDGLTAGKSVLLKSVWKKARAGLFSDMENSTIPLHKLAIANSVYKLPEVEKPTQETTPAAMLPDLSGYISQLETPKSGIDPENETI